MKKIEIMDKSPYLFGLIEDFRRLPREITDLFDDRKPELSTFSSGGRIRLRTDSRKIICDYTLLYDGLLNHKSMCAKSGTDLYINGVYRRNFSPCTPEDFTVHGEAELDGEMNDIELYLPLYNGIKTMTLSFDDNCRVLPPQEYRFAKPVVFYGSSITNGSCATRPGVAYSAILERRFGFDFRNLGFAGHAFGESVIAEYIASLDMTAFVLDYDHNCKSVEHLAGTHKPFYDIVRKAHPALPIIMVTAPDFAYNTQNKLDRRAVIMQSYLDAYNSGDRNVFFVDGSTFYRSVPYPDLCTIDTTHPNDLGHSLMAEGIGEAVKLALDIH